MTRDEAARLLTALGSGWPQVTLTADQAEVWYRSALERTTFDVGLAVVMRLVETEERFPTVARFNEVRRAVERRNSESDEPPKAIEAALPRGARNLAAKKARLIELETPGTGDLRTARIIPTERRVHHHGSVQSCEFCMERLALSEDEVDERLAELEAAS